MPKERAPNLISLPRFGAKGEKRKNEALKLTAVKHQKNRVRHFISLFVGIFYKETLVLFYSLTTCGTVHIGKVGRCLVLFIYLQVFKTMK